MYESPIIIISILITYQDTAFQLDMEPGDLHVL